MQNLVSALSSRGVARGVRYRGVLSNLRRRGLLHIFGRDAVSFLNGLVCQRLGTSKEWDGRGSVAVSAPILTGKGRVLADSLLYYRPGTRSFFLEADRSVLSSILLHLGRYKLRSTVHFEPDVASAYDVFSLLATDPEALKSLIIRLAHTASASQLSIYPDPRWPLALRLIAPTLAHRP